LLLVYEFLFESSEKLNILLGEPLLKLLSLGDICEEEDIGSFDFSLRLSFKRILYHSYSLYV
jgi:hypothetical protein